MAQAKKQKARGSAKPFKAVGKYSSPAKTQTTVGAAPISPSADKRLKPRTPAPSFPSSPLPQVGQTVGSDSIVTDARLYYFKLTRYSSLRFLTPELLGQYYDLFEQGYLRYLALMYDAIARRDPILQSVINKRSGAVKRLKLEVIIAPDVPAGKKAEAEAHQAELRYFYDNLRCTSSVDANLLAGRSELIEQMMRAEANRWAVHEIIYQPTADGHLTARFNYIPLWFFENRMGRLRFLELDYQLDGRDLVPGSFMITTGHGLMEACSAAYLYKSLALKWWLRYVEGHASPLTVGVTNAPRGSSNFANMNRAINELVDRIMISKEEDIKKIDLGKTGELPYLPMVDEMNRCYATIWRGADLSTISGRTSQGGQGALLQGKEEFNLQCDDAEKVTETLNFQVDPQVIGWKFGAGTVPLAYAKLVVPPLVDNVSEIAIINAFNAWGIEVGKNQVLEAFGKQAMPDGDERIDPPPVPAAAGGAGNPANANPGTEYRNELENANERLAPDVEEKLLTGAKEEIARSTAAALKPLADSLDAVLAVPPEARPLAYRRFKDGLPELLDRINRNPANQEALAGAISASWFNGLVNAEVARSAKTA